MLDILQIEKEIWRGRRGKRVCVWGGGGGGQNNQVVLTTVTSPMNDGTGSWYLA